MFNLLINKKNHLLIFFVLLSTQITISCYEAFRLSNVVVFPMRDYTTIAFWKQRACVDRRKSVRFLGNSISKHESKFDARADTKMFMTFYME